MTINDIPNEGGLRGIVFVGVDEIVLGRIFRPEGDHCRISSKAAAEASTSSSVRAKPLGRKNPRRASRSAFGQCSLVNHTQLRNTGFSWMGQKKCRVSIPLALSRALASTASNARRSSLRAPKTH